MKSKEKTASPQKITRLGKDEMNLVEHPFALLKRSSETVFLLEWEKIHPRTQKPIKASWRVSGDSELGLPGPPEERLYLVLMEFSREQGWPQTVVFSRHDLLNRLGMSKANTNYAALSVSFLRLKSVTIDAKRSFWKSDVQDFAANLQFNVLDEVEIINEEPGRRKGQIPLALSSFTWSRVLHQSFIAGNIRSLPTDFALSLHLPLSARLFRYLDKHRTGDAEVVRNKFEIELHRLCEIHLGMTKAKYASKLKERLLPALQELKNRGFLSDWQYEPMKSAPGLEKAVFFFANGALATERPPDSPPQILVETPNALAPVFAVLSHIEQGDDGAQLDDACDRAFSTLDLAVQDGVNARAKATLAPFLQENLRSNGAVKGMEKERRAIVWSEHKTAVYEALGSAETKAEMSTDE